MVVVNLSGWEVQECMKRDQGEMDVKENNMKMLNDSNRIKAVKECYKIPTFSLERKCTVTLQSLFMMTQEIDLWENLCQRNQDLFCQMWR